MSAYPDCGRNFDQKKLKKPSWQEIEKAFVDKVNLTSINSDFQNLND